MSSEFGEWLEAELAKRGWSMRQLALRAGVHPASVTNIVRSGATPRMKTILKMAEALEADPMVMLRIAGIVPTFVPETTDEDHLLRLFRALPHRIRQGVLWMMRGVHAEYLRRNRPSPLKAGQRVRVVLEGTVVKEYDEPDHYLVTLDEAPDIFHRDELYEVGALVARQEEGGG
jgi:transcriptional regulator with XRE-family HTH domain